MTNHLVYIVKMYFVPRGNLNEAVKSFKQAIALSNSESEMAHLFSLMEAAEVQVS